jgi:hypothetical protein
MIRTRKVEHEPGKNTPLPLCGPCVLSVGLTHAQSCPTDDYLSSACINRNNFLQFAAPPSNAPAEQKALAADIVGLDHRAHEQLGPDTPEWKEVLGVLVNAANVGILYNEVPQGRMLYQQAEQTFLRYFEAKNRIRYLIGLGLGVFICTLFSGLLFLIARSLSQPFIKPGLLPLLCLFAGIGSLTSVLMRLDQIDLRFATSVQLVMISGAARPVIAICLALVVYLVLDLKLLDIKFGAPTEQNQNSIFLISSFVCGFSERFGQDILSKVAGVMGGG